jgi:hypothetical protein
MINGKITTSLKRGFCAMEKKPKFFINIPEFTGITIEIRRGGIDLREKARAYHPSP